MKHMNHAAAACLALISCVLLLSPATHSQAPSPLTLEVTEPAPTGDELDETWTPARIERAGRLLLDGRAVTVQMAVATLKKAEVKDRPVVIRCHPAQETRRFLSVAAALGQAGLVRSGLSLGLSDPESSPRAVQVIDLEGSAAPSPGAKRISTRFGRFDDDYLTITVSLTLHEGAARLSFYGEEIESHDSLEDMRKALAARVTGEEAEGKKVSVSMTLRGDVPCRDLHRVLTLFHAFAVEEVFLLRGFNTDISAMFGRLATRKHDWIGREIATSLKVLAAIQEPSGRWTGRASGGLDDVGRTGLAVLAFLADFHTPEEGEHQESVRSGLRFLREKQNDAGLFASSEGGLSLNHALATRAMIEAYGLTGADEFERSSRSALRALLRCRRADGAWSSAAGGSADLVLTTWAAMAVRAADDCGLDVDPDALEKTSTWATAAMEEDGGTKLMSQLDFGVDRFFGRHPGSSATALLLLRNRVGVENSEQGATERLVLDSDPNAGSDCLPDYDYLYFGSLALNDVGSTHWDAWRKELEVAVFRCLAEARGRTGMAGILELGDETAAEEADPAATSYLAMCLMNAYRFSQSFEAPK